MTRHKITRGLPYQLEGVREIDNFRGNAILGDEMGLGKTYQALLWAHWNDIKRIVVVCPATLKINWAREAQTHFNISSDICYGKKPTKNQNFTSRIVIINYEILSGWASHLLKYGPTLLICDEAHRVCNRGNQTYKNVFRIAQDTPHLLCLTGTPLTNKPAELWALLNMCCPSIWPSFHKYAWRYCRPRRTIWGWKYDGATNLPELHKIAKKHCLIRRLTKDVIQDLPKRATRIIQVGLKDYKQYQLAKDNFIAFLKLNGKPTKSKTTKDKQKKTEVLGQINVLRQLVGELKRDSIVEWIENFLLETDRKLVVFGHHKKLLKSLHDKHKTISVLVNGTTPKAKRQRLIDSFQHDKRVRLFYGNMKSAGEGITLTAASDTLIIELPWTPKDIAQARARTERIGQTRKTTCWFMIAEKTIEMKQLSLLQEKQSISNSVLDGKDVGYRNFYDQVLSLLD